MWKFYAMRIFLYLLMCLSSTSVDCACPNEVKNQTELNNSIDDVITFRNSGRNGTRCTQWILTGSAYQLDLIKLLTIKLQQNDSLIIQGHNGTMVDIDCVGGPSNLEETLKAIQPLSHASLFVLDIRGMSHTHISRRSIQSNDQELCFSVSNYNSYVASYPGTICHGRCYSYVHA